MTATVKHVRHGTTRQRGIDSRRDQRELLQQQKAALVRRTVRRLGLTEQQVAEDCNAHQTQVSLWMNARSPASPTLQALITAPAALVDDLLSSLAELRTRNGHAPRQWSAPAEVQSAEVTELEARAVALLEQIRRAK